MASAKGNKSGDVKESTDSSTTIEEDEKGRFVGPQIRIQLSLLHQSWSLFSTLSFTHLLCFISLTFIVHFSVEEKKCVDRSSTVIARDVNEGRFITTSRFKSDIKFASIFHTRFRFSNQFNKCCCPSTTLQPPEPPPPRRNNLTFHAFKCCSQYFLIH